MTTSLTATASIIITTPANKVWEALTQPELIKQYMFGSDVSSDWQVGSPITWKGEWQGKPYEDKGTITKLIPNQVIEYTHSYAGATQDNIVTNELTEQDGATRLTITQTGNADEAARDHSEKNWNMVLEAMKKMLETQ